MSDSNNVQLQAVIKMTGLPFVAKNDHFLIHFGIGSHPMAMGFRLLGNIVASAFVCPRWVGSRQAGLAPVLVPCLNRCMPVGAWDCNGGSGRLRYTCHLPVPKDPAGHCRFLANVLHRQTELMNTCCDAIVVAQRRRTISKPQEVVSLAMSRLQPLAESLPPEDRVTQSQWNRAMKALNIDADNESAGCQTR